MNDVTKLPKWAQNLIKKLERDVEYGAERLRRVSGEDGTVHVISNPYSDVPINLPDDTIRFSLDRGYVDVIRSRDGTHLQVRTSGSNEYPCIMPEVANEVKIYLMDRR